MDDSYVRMSKRWVLIMFLFIIAICCACIYWGVLMEQGRQMHQSSENEATEQYTDLWSYADPVTHQCGASNLEYGLGRGLYYDHVMDIICTDRNTTSGDHLVRYSQVRGSSEITEEIIAHNIVHSNDPWVHDLVTEQFGDRCQPEQVVLYGRGRGYQIYLLCHREDGHLYYQFPGMMGKGRLLIRDFHPHAVR